MKHRFKFPESACWALAPGLLIAALLVSLPHYGEDSGASNPQREKGLSDLETVRSEGVLHFITIPEQVSPFMAVDLEADQAAGPMPLKGVDYDLLSLFAQHLGVELELTLPAEPNLTALWDGLGHGGIAQAAAGGLSILPSRLERFDFSEPYYRSNLAIVTRTDSSWDSIAQTRHLKAAICRGASSGEHWKRYADPTGEIHWADFTIETLAMVAEGLVDIAVEDSAFVINALESLPTLKIAFTIPIDDHYGIVFKEGSDLVPEFNALLREIKKSGELERILNHHLGSKSPQPEAPKIEAPQAQRLRVFKGAPTANRETSFGGRGGKTKN